MMRRTGKRAFCVLQFAGGFLSLLICFAGCGPRRETAQSFVCRIDDGRLIPGSIIVSADRRHLMLAESDGRRQRVVIDGRAGPWYDGILAGTLAISHDGKRYAYGAGRGEFRFVVLDGAEQSKCDGIREGTPVFSPDGNRIAWGEQRDFFWSMTIDGRAGWQYYELWPPVFSPDGKHIAYATRTGPKMFVVIDSIQQSPYDAIVEQSLVFSPDGAHLTYFAIDRGRRVFIRDGRPAKPVSSAPPSRDRILADSSDPQSVKMSVIRDNIRGPAYEQVTGIAYSPDSARFGYFARQDSQWFAVIDGKRRGTHPNIFEHSLIFTPDGKHAMFATKAGNMRFVVLDDQPGQGYNLIFDENDKPIVVDSDQSFHYLALKGDSVFVVEERIK